MKESGDQKKQELCFCESGLSRSHCCEVEGKTALTADVFVYLSERGITAEDAIPAQLQKAIDTISENPDLFPARVNLFTDKAWFIKMTPSMYRKSVFLDPGRVKGTCLLESDLNWLKKVCDKISRQPTSFIFHSAFCGSTLMSQIMETTHKCFSLREPELLSSMLIYNRSEAPSEEKSLWFNNLQKLLSRRYAADEPVVVKANDFATPLIQDILQWDQDAPILFMYTPLNEFIAGCLKADNRREWIRQRYDSIKAFLPGVFDIADEIDIDESNDGQLAATYWSYNMAIYLKAYSEDKDNVKSLDFNEMLASPVDVVRQCANLLGLQPRANVDSESAIAQKMGVYSKNNTYKYSADQRRNELLKQIEESSEDQKAGEQLARTLMGNAYPENGLPGSVLGSG